MSAFFPAYAQQMFLAAAYTPVLFCVVPTLDGIAIFWHTIAKTFEKEDDLSIDPYLLAANLIQYWIAAKNFPEAPIAQTPCLSYERDCGKATRKLLTDRPYLLKYWETDPVQVMNEIQRLLGRQCPCV